MADPKGESDGGVAGAKALVTVGVAGVALAHPIVGTALSALPDLFEFAIGKWKERGAKRSAAWWWRYVEMRPGLTDEGARAELADGLDDPQVAASLIESVRGMLDAISDEAAPALGALTALYLGQKRPPDRFFRSVCRTLVDLQVDELVQLQQLVATIATRAGDDTGDYQIYAAGAGQVQLDTTLLAARTEDRPFLLPTGAAIVELLARNGLAEGDKAVLTSTIEPGPRLGRINLGVARRLRTIVGEPTNPPSDEET